MAAKFFPLPPEHVQLYFSMVAFHFFLTPSIKTNALNREKVSLPVYYSLISSMPNLLDVSSQFRCSGSDKQIYM